MLTKNDCCNTNINSKTFEEQLLVVERCFGIGLLLMATAVIVLGGKVYADLDRKQVSALNSNTILSYADSPDVPFTVPSLDSFIVPTAPAAAKSKAYSESIEISSGQNLSLIFKEQNINTDYLRAMLKADPLAMRLQQIQPGQTIKIQYVDNTFAGLEYVADPTYSLLAIRDGDSFEFVENRTQYKQQTRRASATISSSLFKAAKNSGISEKTTMELAELFGWDIDFALDIRKGDRFSVVYHTLHYEGKKIKDGDILAAEFINQGKVYRAVKYTDPEGNSGYYDPQGENMHKPFLRTPVDFTRISSRFGNRYHPVSNKMRSHNGVDYAAPRGTRVRSSGDGVIVFQGSLRGYGNTVIVDHGAGYRTLYAHLHKYYKRQDVGSNIKQGQTIGYVGSSGLATGPHLHYEFLINGKHRNPLTVRVPTANPLNKKYIADFKQKASTYLAMLPNTTNKLLAMNSVVGK